MTVQVRMIGRKTHIGIPTKVAITKTIPKARQAGIHLFRQIDLLLRPEVKK